MRLKSCKVFIAFFEIILGISATTHWVVTENGRIQAQVCMRACVCVCVEINNINISYYLV